MKAPDDITRLRHMLESSQEACGFLGTMTADELRMNRMQALAIVRSLEIIGEAASQITQQFKDEHPEIEWRVIIGMLNRLIHAYFEIDYQVVWRTVRENLPPFIKTISAILAKDET